MRIKESNQIYDLDVNDGGIRKEMLGVDGYIVSQGRLKRSNPLILPTL